MSQVEDWTSGNIITNIIKSCFILKFIETPSCWYSKMTALAEDIQKNDTDGRNFDMRQILHKDMKKRHRGNLTHH